MTGPVLLLLFFFTEVLYVPAYIDFHQFLALVPSLFEFFVLFFFFHVYVKIASSAPLLLLPHFDFFPCHIFSIPKG